MKKIKYQYLLLGTLILAGCEKLVEINPPQEQLVTSEVFASDEAAISATTGLYARIMNRDYPISYNMAMYTGLYADELEYRQTVPAVISAFKNSLIAKDAPTNGIWTNGFNYIYHANALIEGLNKSSNVSKAVKNQLYGEALFVRAFWNFYLSNLFGPIPLIVSTDYNVTSQQHRTELEDIQTQILDDLSKSKALLTEKYVAGNSITESLTERIRPNTFTVSALLARVYLQLGSYDKAIEESNRVIADSKYALAELSQVFKRTSKEVIWQLELPTNTNSSNSYEAVMFTLSTRPSATLTVRCTTISPQLLSLFAGSDKRGTIWISAVTDNTVKHNYPSKYKSKTTPADEYTTPIRLAELYLIRAEASAMLNKLSDAIIDTDKIRVRAGLERLSVIIPNIDKAALLDSISNERRRELFCEWGLRWFDIKRSTNSAAIMSDIAAKKMATWKATAIVWPIPLNDVLNSGNKIQQNEGYN